MSLINRKAGQVRNHNWVSRLEALPTSVAVVAVTRPGEPWPETADLLSSPGYVYLFHPDPEAVATDYRKIREWEGDLFYTS